jgi:prepilin-type N-terminal cleavage/methylation domain-containing protein
MSSPTDCLNRAPQRARPASAGFSMVELMAAIVILTVAISGFTSSILSSMVLSRMNRESGVAQQAARQMLEQIHGEEFREAFFAFNTAAGDYGGGGVEFGPGFPVQGLDLLPADGDGLVGRIEFPTVDFGGVEQLREDVVDAGFGMPRDLDGDGIDVDDHSGDYELLPVRVIVEWNGVRGPRQVTMESILSSQ